MVGRAVAKEAQRDLGQVPVLAGVRDPRCQRHVTADDAVAAQKAVRRIKHVHRPAHARANPRRLAHQLRQHALGDVQRGARFGDGMAVLAVGTDHVVLFAQR